MENEDIETVRYNLVSLMIGLISSIDLINQRDILQLSGDEMISELYKKSVDDHCAMLIYENNAEH